MNNALSAVPALACYHLSKTYQDGHTICTVLSDVNITLQSAEMVAVIGHSGAGKSTLLHLLGGLDQPTSGTVELNGRDYQIFSEIERCHWRNRHLGFVYQFHHLLPEFTVLENVGMPLLIQAKAPSEIMKRCMQLLILVGLQHRASHRIAQLSGGERQRAAIARALIHSPRCILADEPTGNLDAQNATQVLQLFFELQQRCSTSVILATHDINIAKQAHRTVLLADGILHPY